MSVSTQTILSLRSLVHCNERVHCALQVGQSQLQTWLRLVFAVFGSDRVSLDQWHRQKTVTSVMIYNKTPQCTVYKLADSAVQICTKSHPYQLALFGITVN